MAFRPSAALIFNRMLRLRPFLLPLAIVSAVHAADAPAPPIKEGNVLGARALSPSEQQQRFKLPEGFRIELVASEETGLPKPVSIAFDDAGRLWTQTATEYPRDQDPAVWKKPGRDRVVVIDAPHRPSPQPVRTFADGMVMPLSVLPYDDGAFVAQGPDLLFLADTDHDGKADRRTTLVSGFGVQDTHTLPHQLVQLPGGRIGFSQGVLNNGVIVDAGGRGHVFNKTIVASMTPQGTDLRFHSAGLNNIWCWAQDRVGRVFIHEANDLGYSLVPFEEDSSYPSFIDLKLHPDAPLHPPTAEGLNLGGTGFSGIAIVDDRSGSFPDAWQGRFLISNPILGAVHAVGGTTRPDGVWSFEKRGDLVTCDDPMFRPVAITFGPDGCLYIVDWYNRIISHNEVARDHPGRDKDHGRIWRVRHESQASATITDYTKVPTSQLPAALKSDRTWAMRAAWHQIGQRRDKTIIPALVAQLRDGRTPIDAKIHTLWSLEDLGHFDAPLWAFLLTQPSPDLRREAVRALGTLQVPPAEAVPLLRNLAGESTWTVRYEVLRYFRRAAGPTQPEHLAWLRPWSAPAATTTQVAGWKGPYLALDGSYQRAFQDFLLTLAETKTQLPVITPSKWNQVIAQNPVRTDSRAMSARIAAVQAALPKAKAEDGRTLAEGICLTCHSIGGHGIGFAPPLDGSARRDVEGLISAIVDPNAAIEGVFRTFRIVTADGRTVEGFNKSETRQAITLVFAGGGSQVVPIKQIQSAGYVEGQSVMPDITASMTPEQIAGIVAYLRSVK